MREIELTRGYKALVDDEDYNRINAYKWFASVQVLASGTVYVRAARMINRKMVYMHHQVLNKFPDELNGNHIDHEDRNPLNNQKYNLIEKSPAANMQNSGRALKRKGYSFNSRAHLWSCYIDRPGRARKYIGYAKTEEEAIAKVEAYRANNPD